MKFFEPFEACLECGGKDFRKGPRGGVATNIACVNCGHDYNVAFVEDIVALKDITLSTLRMLSVKMLLINDLGPATYDDSAKEGTDGVA